MISVEKEFFHLTLVIDNDKGRYLKRYKPNTICSFLMEASIFVSQNK